jgi:hypothetical protein
VVLALSVLIVGYLFGPGLFARWSIFDDHEIMSYLGSSEHLSFSQVIPKLMLTEVGSQSDLPRFRPAYYTLRLIETWAWGKHPGAWYASHLLVCLFFVWALWSRTLGKIGVLASGLLTLYTMTLPFWPGIFAALGPGEAYAVLGLALVSIGFDRAYRDGRSRAGWLILLLGVVVAAGSKENFLILIAPVLFLLCRGIITGTTNWIAWLSAGAAASWCVWIAAVVYGRVQQIGVDVYGNSTDAVGRLHLLLRAVRQPGIMPFYAVGALFLLLGLFLRSRRSSAARPCYAALGAMAFIVGLYLSQVVFYHGDWPTGDRNDLPGMLSWPATLFVVLWLLNRLGGLMLAGKTYRGALLVSTLAIGAGAVVANAGNIAEIRREAENNVHGTTAFTAEIDSLSVLAHDHPSYPVLIQSTDPADFEPLISYPRFLVANGVSNEMFLLWTPSRHGVSNYKGSLSAQLVGISKGGAPGQYQPISRLTNPGDQCILVVLSGAARQPCRFQVDGSWRRFY